jgi:hypothetical protein
VSILSSDAKNQPADEPTASASTLDEADTEGHSFSIAMGVNQLAKGSPDKARSRTPDPELKPLTKQWPSMREEKRG